MNDGASKAERLLQIEALLLQHPEGMTQADIARRLGVNRSTINRYIPSLPGHVYIDDFDGGKLKIDRSVYLVNVRFSLHEATAIHLAVRLLASSITEQNAYAAAAVRKLAISMEKLAPHISSHMSRSADLMDGMERYHHQGFIDILEKLTLAWAGGRKVIVYHQLLNSDQVYEYSFAPFFIEPYAAGLSIHVIGLSKSTRGTEKIRTFKIERIVKVEETDELYKIPDDFDPFELLKDAWGIWFTGDEPMTVMLRFSARVADRVRATCWHASQRLEDQPDGTLIWSADIAEPTEMKPWIRGWGADVEVLEPENLRNEVMAEIKRMNQLYRKEDLKI